MWIMITYLWAINCLTLLAFGFDKLRARRRKRRVSEKRLLLLAALGGSLAALLGSWIFSHKTRKRGFSAILLMIVVFQGAAVFLLITQGVPQIS
ncbi:DUF1294 domain-containing protein [Ruegeria arenilitoris]|uniref:DUF1294 domain-containing protein n=1 Tax=Ruegeria arenilitoris TaxID=1173585 RepID=UPI00147D2B2D|nr:DUF1294 domain-containing protein [Ruegeria arenilitoris]